jgi:hypothetical protein
MPQVVTFREFTDDEVLVGYHYAEEKVRTPVNLSSLRRIANDAGILRLSRPGFKPRDAATQALWAYEQRNGNMTEAKSEAYIRSVAKMLSERNSKTKAKRERDALAEEAKAAAYGLNTAQNLSPTIQLELFEATRSKADT